MFETVWVQLVMAQAETAATNQPKGVLEILTEASGVVLGVLCILGIMSLISWFIIGYKWLYLLRAQRESVQFLEIFWQSKRLDVIYKKTDDYPRSPISQVFKAGYIELTNLKGTKESAGEQGSGMTGHLTGIENIDSITVPDGAQAMGHDDAGSVELDPFECLLYRPFGLRVDG